MDASNRKRYSMDLNVRAFRTVQAALSEIPTLSKRQAASRKGGLAGGRARAKSVSPERRKEIAKAASLARWGTPRKGR